ncbi:MAG: glycosyltransferase [Desulfurococcaceae archaeon]
MDHPLVSIVLTTYNSRATLPLVLNAILKQTYPLNKVELIIVDGGSKDETIDIIKRFLNENSHKFNTVRLIIHDKNYGVSKARNDGIKVSKGDFILILDADVVLAYNALELMIEKSRECDVVLAFLIPSYLSKLDEIKIRIAKEVDCKSFDTYYATNAALISRNVIEKVGLFNEELGPPFSLHEDIEYGARIKRKGFKICRYRSITAQHFSAEHDLGTFDIPRTAKFKSEFPRYFRYMFSYLTNWYGRSYYQFIRQLSIFEKVKWFSYSLVPVAILGLIVSLVLNEPMVAMLALAFILMVFVVTLNECFNNSAKLSSIIYASIAIILRSIRMISVIKFMLRLALTYKYSDHRLGLVSNDIRTADKHLSNR